MWVGYTKQLQCTAAIRVQNIFRVLKLKTSVQTIMLPIDLWVNFLLNTKLENCSNKHAGGVVMMHWQRINARKLSEVSIYKVTQNDNGSVIIAGNHKPSVRRQLEQTKENLDRPVLPSPLTQNMPNCVSRYAKQGKNMPIFFVTRKQLKNRQ